MMCSTMSEPHWCQIWQDCQMPDARCPIQFHRTSNGENPSRGFRDMRSAKSGSCPPTRYDNTPPAQRAEGQRPSIYSGSVLSGNALLIEKIWQWNKLPTWQLHKEDMSINMHVHGSHSVEFCCGLFHVSFTISFRVASLALGQSQMPQCQWSKP